MATDLKTVCFNLLLSLDSVVGLQTKAVRPKARLVHHRVVRRQLVCEAGPSRQLYRSADEGGAGGTLHDGGADAESG